MQRYFVDKKDNEIIFKDNDIFHIKKVMRMKNNDIIEVVFDNRVYKTKIVDIDNVTIEIIEEIKTIEDSFKVTIAQALVREQKWDLIIQKLTELGVYEIIPLDLERCNLKIEKNKEKQKIERWTSICKEASEQSFRNNIPNIHSVSDLKELVKLDYDLKIFCSTNEKSIHLKKILQNMKKCDNILVVIGSEGGLSSNEEKLMIENGFKSVTLGNTILRTETAPIFVLSAINYELWS